MSLRSHALYVRLIGTVLLRIRGGITIQVCNWHRLMNDDPHPTLSPERAMSLRSYALYVRLIGTVLLRIKGGITIRVCNGHRLMNDDPHPTLSPDGGLSGSQRMEERRVVPVSFFLSKVCCLTRPMPRAYHVT